MGSLTLYHAQGCHLCERALGTLEELRAELRFDLRAVDIGGDPELERRYRELIPVVELEGRRIAVFHVREDAVRRALAARSQPRQSGA